MDTAGGSNYDDPIEILSDSEDIDIVQPVPKEVEDVLSNFREMWQKELRSTPRFTNNDSSDGESRLEQEDHEQKAKTFYLRGAEMERLGNFYEAILWYKRAVQLVPDIDFKVHQKCISNFNREEGSDNDSETEEHNSDEHTHSDDDDSNKDQQTLLIRIQRKMNKAQSLCLPAYPQRTAHISELPMEILLYVLKWVVSSDLDLRSLELCSVVCRGFYLCARDQEIWRLACIRAWGVNCGNLSVMYPTWRDMYIKRTRLHFNGCYISKTTYIRNGENSFQDQFYRPWHLVAYYRYLRFFPDGLVFMLTTPDEPSQCVGQLKNRAAKAPTVLSGHYRLKDDKVTIVVQHQELGGRQANVFKRGRRRNEILYEGGEQSFHLELRIQSVKRYRHVQLEWTHYSIFTRYRNGAETQSTFELANSRFPPLWFSRVKSYAQESSSPLQ